MRLLGGFIVIIVIAWLFLATIKWIGIALMALMEFFLNSWWGFAAIGCAVLSILFFYVSAKIYPDVRAKDKFFREQKDNLEEFENLFK